MNDITTASAMPHSEEAEKAVLGAVLLDPPVVRMLSEKLGEHDFFFLRHALIYRAMIEMDAAGHPCDYLTLTEAMRAAGTLDDAGGPAALLQLVNHTPTSLNAERYAMIVKRMSGRRQLIAAADRIRAAALNEAIPFEEVLAASDTALMAVGKAETPWRSTHKDALLRHAEMVDEAMKAPGPRGVPSSMSALNVVLKGYQPGRLYIIGARPGMGKSSLLTTEAAYAAGTLGKKSLFVTLEIGETELVSNLVAAQTHITTDSMETGRMHPETYGRYVSKTTDMWAWADMTIDSSPTLTISELRSAARRLHYTQGLDIIYVDYLQLLGTGRDLPKQAQREQQIAHISRSLKALAKELNIPVVVAAQLSRELEKRQDKRPQLSDLRESGAIEQDADVVLFLYRDDKYNPPVVVPPQGTPSKTEIIVAKNRAGQADVTVLAAFYGAWRTFREIEG